jgi:hypothetical protein
VVYDLSLNFHLAAALTIFCQKLSTRRCCRASTPPAASSLLQLPVLILQQPQPLGLGHDHVAVVGLPVVQGGFRDAVLAR